MVDELIDVINILSLPRCVLSSTSDNHGRLKMFNFTCSSLILQVKRNILVLSYDDDIDIDNDADNYDDIDDDGDQK